MAWEWSHDPIAYEYAREQLHTYSRFNRKTLLDIAREWIDKLELNFSAMKIGNATNGELAELIWGYAESYDHGRTCSNGGHELYLCPDGCHTVDLREMPSDWTPEEH
jgi:hypothetical protein